MTWNHIGNDQQVFYLQVLQIFYQQHQEDLLLAANISTTFWSSEKTDETFQQSGKPDFSKYILKIIADMYESSGSQFFKTTFQDHVQWEYNQDHVLERHTRWTVLVNINEALYCMNIFSIFQIVIMSHILDYWK